MFGLYLFVLQYANSVLAIYSEINIHQLRGQGHHNSQGQTCSYKFYLLSGEMDRFIGIDSLILQDVLEM